MLSPFTQSDLKSSKFTVTLNYRTRYVRVQGTSIDASIDIGAFAVATCPVQYETNDEKVFGVRVDHGKVFLVPSKLVNGDIRFDRDGEFEVPFKQKW